MKLNLQTKTAYWWFATSNWFASIPSRCERNNRDRLGLLISSLDQWVRSIVSPYFVNNELLHEYDRVQDHRSARMNNSQRAIIRLLTIPNYVSFIDLTNSIIHRAEERNAIYRRTNIQKPSRWIGFTFFNKHIQLVGDLKGTYESFEAFLALMKNQAAQEILFPALFLFCPMEG